MMRIADSVLAEKITFRKPFTNPKNSTTLLAHAHLPLRRTHINMFRSFWLLAALLLQGWVVGTHAQLLDQQRDSIPCNELHAMEPGGFSGVERGGRCFAGMGEGEVGSPQGGAARYNQGAYRSMGRSIALTVSALPSPVLSRVGLRLTERRGLLSLAGWHSTGRPLGAVRAGQEHLRVRYPHAS